MMRTLMLLYAHTYVLCMYVLISFSNQFKMKADIPTEHQSQLIKSNEFKKHYV